MSIAPSTILVFATTSVSYVRLPADCIGKWFDSEAKSRIVFRVRRVSVSHESEDGVSTYARRAVAAAGPEQESLGN